MSCAGRLIRSGSRPPELVGGRVLIGDRAQPGLGLPARAISV